MPTVNTTLYLSDDEYAMFIPRKAELLDKMRNFIRAEMGIEKKIKNERIGESK